MRGAVWLLYQCHLGWAYMQLEALAEQLVMWIVQPQLTNAQVPLYPLPSCVDHSRAQGCGCAVIGTRMESLQREQYLQLLVANGHASFGALQQRSTVGATDALRLDLFLHIHNECEFVHLKYQMYLRCVSHNTRICTRFAPPSLNQVMDSHLASHQKILQTGPMKLARAKDFEVDTEAYCDGEVVVEDEWCHMMVVLPAKRNRPGVLVQGSSVDTVRYSPQA